MQNVNQNTIEDLCIPDIKHDVNLGCFEAYSIFDSEDITKHLGSSIRNNFDHVACLDKLKSILELDQLNIEERKQVYRLLEKHADRFQLEGDELSATNITKHRILTVDEYPVNTKQYRLPHNLRTEVDKQVNELLEKGIIRPSKSPYNTSLWVVPKKPDQSGKPRWRVVLDFRPLNEKTIPMAYPLPNITDIFDQVGNACYFTVIDCVWVSSNSSG